MRREMRQHKRYALTASDRKFGHGGVALAARGNRCAKLDGMRACRGEQRAFDAMHPRNGDAVIESHDEIHAHRHAAAHAIDDPHDVVAIRPQRHAIGDAYSAVCGLDLRFENQRAIAIPAAHCTVAADRRNLEASVTAPSQECREARRTVESRQAQPVDRTVARNKRGGSHVADQCVVFDVRRHRLSTPISRPSADRANARHAEGPDRPRAVPMSPGHSPAPEDPL